MRPEELRSLISKGESETLELKTSAPPPPRLAILLASLANTNGGYLVIGVREPADVVGVDERMTRALIEHARTLLDGEVNLSVEFIPLDGKPVGVVSVSRAPGIVAAGGGYYRRVGESTRPLNAQQIKEHVTHGQSPELAINELSRAVASSATVIDQLRQDFAKANSPWRRVLWVVIGAIAGGMAKGLIDHFWK